MGTSERLHGSYAREGVIIDLLESRVMISVITALERQLPMPYCEEHICHAGPWYMWSVVLHATSKAV